MHILLGLATVLIGGALVIRIIKGILCFTYKYSPSIVIWGVIIMALYSTGYFQPIEQDMKDIHANITQSIEN